MSHSKSPKKKKGIPNLKVAPPKETRYCIICDKFTLWKYNKGLGHGQCIECGSLSLYSGLNKEDVLKKLELHKNGFNFIL
jgi:hypothetical protein